VAGPCGAAASPVQRWYFSCEFDCRARPELARRRFVRRAGTTARLLQRAGDVETFNIAPEGEAYPISSDTSAAFRLTGDALQATFKNLTGQSDALTCIPSADQKVIT
jgi:hypothetical protein